MRRFLADVALAAAGVASMALFSSVAPYNMDEFIHYDALACSFYPGNALFGECDPFRFRPKEVVQLARDYGTLAPGMWADFIIVDTDPTLASPGQLRNTSVEQTWVGGKMMWSRAQQEAAR